MSLDHKQSPWRKREGSSHEGEEGEGRADEQTVGVKKGVPTTGGGGGEARPVLAMKESKLVWGVHIRI